MVLPLALLSAGAWLAWREAWGDSERELPRIADAGAEYGLRVLAGYGIAANRLNDLVRGLTEDEIRAHPPALRDSLRALLAELPQAEAALVLDRQGEPLVVVGLDP